MPGYAFFNAFSNLAIPGPRKIEVIKKLSELVVIHRLNLCLSDQLFKKNSMQLIAREIE